MIEELEGHLARMKHDPVALSQQLGVSPTSLEKVKRACSTGALLTNSVRNCTPTENSQSYTNKHLNKVSACIGPAIAKLCEMSKFADNKGDAHGVAQLILNKLGRKRARKVGDTRTKAKARRKLDFHMHRRVLGKDLCDFLGELATSWRQAFRLGEREAADRILQLTLVAIPAKRKRVSDWLGPMFFNEELPVEAGSNIRLVRKSDRFKGKYRFRNRYTSTSLSK